MNRAIALVLVCSLSLPCTAASDPRDPNPPWVHTTYEATTFAYVKVLNGGTSNRIRNEGVARACGLDDLADASERSARDKLDSAILDALLEAPDIGALDAGQLMAAHQAVRLAFVAARFASEKAAKQMRIVAGADIGVFCAAAAKVMREGAGQ
jgi:hypothetical protein